MSTGEQIGEVGVTSMNAEVSCSYLTVKSAYNIEFVKLELISSVNV